MIRNTHPSPSSAKGASVDKRLEGQKHELATSKGLDSDACSRIIHCFVAPLYASMKVNKEFSFPEWCWFRNKLSWGRTTFSTISSFKLCVRLKKGLLLISGGRQIHIGRDARIVNMISLPWINANLEEFRHEAEEGEDLMLIRPFEETCQL